MTGSALVVGAGVAGLAAAIALRQQGWEVEVLERRAQLDDRGAALGLWPAAQRGLAALGVADRLQPSWVPYREAWIRAVDGRRLTRLPLARIERREGLPVVLVHRRLFLAALLERLRELGVGPTFGATAPDPARRAQADVVVGADGINSELRPLVDPKAPTPRDLQAVAWRGSCSGMSDVHGEIWGTGVIAGVTPDGPGRTNWYVAAREDMGLDSFDVLREALHDWPAPVTDVLARTDPADVLRHQLFDLPQPRRYAAGRVVLLGDAAHAMAPSLGQGACQAVLDAVALGRCLREEPDVEQALRRYDRERRPVGRRHVAGSRQLLRVMLASRASRVRDAVAWAGGRLPA